MWLVAVGVVGIVACVIVVIMVNVARPADSNVDSWGTGLACTAGSVIGSLAVYIAMHHNPQGEFIDQVTGAV